MTRAEIFSWCCLLSIGGLAWLAAGVPGALCLLAGAIVSQIDVGWVEEHGSRHDAAMGSAVAGTAVAPDVVRNVGGGLFGRDVEPAVERAA